MYIYIYIYIYITTMESLERAISNHLRRWLGLLRCLSGAALYGNSNALHLPCSSLVEESKITKTRELLRYAESEDPKVAAAGIQIRSGRKWSAKRELQVAEERLRHKAILGSIAKHRAGLGFSPLRIPTVSKAKKNANSSKKKFVRYCKMVSLSQQGAWTRKKGLHGQIAGGRTLARFDYSLNQCMMCYQQTCTYGGRERPLIVNYVLGKDLYNISLVVAQKLWLIVGTVGVTIKHSR